jgi:hypothetical protein
MVKLTVLDQQLEYANGGKQSITQLVIVKIEVPKDVS